MRPPKSSENDELSLYEMETICVDEHGIWHRPDYPEYTEEMAPPKPFLVPSFDNEVVEVLPSEKKNQKLQWSNCVQVRDIENRFQMMEEDEYEQDDEDYEIEIVEGGGNEGGGGGGDDDADFYLEMIDGEIFYVFETEDDISVEDEYESSDDEESSSQESDDSETQTSGTGRMPLQLNIGDMMAPNLGDSFAQLDGLELIAPAAEDADTVEDKKLDDKDAILAQEARPEKPQEDKPSESLSTPPASPTTPTGRRPTFDTTPPGSPVRSPPQSGSRPSSPGTPGTPRSILKACPPSPTRPRKSPRKKRDSIKNKDSTTKKEKKEKTFTKTLVRASDFDGEHRVYSWAKPDWAKEQKLKSTGKGGAIRSGENLAQPITDAKQLIEKGQVKWEKPEWANNGNDDTESDDLCAKEELIRKIQEGSMNLPGSRKKGNRLKLSINGSILAEGGDIVKPITKATIIKKPANINTVANPKILRATPGGAKLWNGENLAGQITQATQNNSKYAWEKPSWAVNKKLHATKYENDEETTTTTTTTKNGKGGPIAPMTPSKKGKKPVVWEKPNWAQERKIGQGLRSESEHGTNKTAPMTPSKKGKKPVVWEKPDWTKERGIGRAASSAEVLAGAQKKNIGWEKPSWTQAKLKPTGGSFREGSLKPTEKGNAARNGGNLAKPITQLPHLVEEEAGRKSPIRRTKSED